MSEETLSSAEEPKRGPGRPPKEPSKDVGDLYGLVSSLSEQVAALTKKPDQRLGVKHRVREHIATMREFANEQNEPIGLVTRLYDVREVKDTTENKRMRGLCTVEVLDPKTKETSKHKDVDYLRFLEDSNKVKAKILSWKREKRYEVDIRKGGGGTGPLYVQSATNQILTEPEHEFEVTFEDHTFTLEITEGAYEGCVLENDGRGLNMN